MVPFMGEKLVEAIREFVDFLNESLYTGRASAGKLLELPPEQWEAWWSKLPEAQWYATLNALVEQAENRLDTDGSSALLLTELITRHVDAVVVPPNLEDSIVPAFLRLHAWKVHVCALRAAGRLEEMQQACETAAAIARAERTLYGPRSEMERDREAFFDTPTVPFPPQPPITEDDVRRANELIDKYGLHHLREEG